MTTFANLGWYKIKFHKKTPAKRVARVYKYTIINIC